MRPWEILSEIARTVLITSLTGGIITLLLFALKPIIKNRLPKSVQYYLWLLALVAFLVPFSRFVSVPASTPVTSVQTIIEENVKSTPEWQEALSQEKYNLPFEELDDLQKINIFYGEIGYMERSLNEAAIYMLSFGWLLAFTMQVLEYCIYVFKLRRRRMPPLENEVTVLRSLCKRMPRLYRNPLAPTPMLVGIFRPVVYLPDIEYSDEQLRNILLHELTHLRRKDVVVKWIAAVAVYLHWFNPLAWLMRREIDRACELACDEAVIKHMDSDGKQSYGNTLIEIAADARKSKMIVSTTMCEEKKALKARLGAIMKHRSLTPLAAAASCVLIIAVLGGTVALGARSVEKVTVPDIAVYAVAENYRVRLAADVDTGIIMLPTYVQVESNYRDNTGTSFLRTYCLPLNADTDTRARMLGGGGRDTVSASDVKNTAYWDIAGENPDGFEGYVWSVVTDSTGAEYSSERLRVKYDPPNAADIVAANIYE